jgi:hypothetical protein
MNPVDANRTGARREFLRAGLRYASVGVLVGVAFVIVRRTGSKLPGPVCLNRSICNGCPTFPSCGLPAALSAKHSRSGGAS